MSSPDTLISRFLSRLKGLAEGQEETPLLVALSGGLDSLVLLHLLRFAREAGGRGLQVAHFDHCMRKESGADANWIRGLCQAWRLPLHLGRAETVPLSEGEGREMRYEFLLAVKERIGATWLLTAHHADDQAETVLFRAFRGTGLKGLAGIPRRRSPGILRPLLPFTREDLEAYAASRKIRCRWDVSNDDLTIPRNLLRHQVLPLVEERVAPGARGALLRLARLARENEAAWDSLLPGILDGLASRTERGIVVARPTLLGFHPAVQGRVLRALVNRLGLSLDEAGTRRMLEFTRGGASGRVLQLPGDLRFGREFDTFLLYVEEDSAGDRILVIPGMAPGGGEAVLGGKRVAVSWGHGVTGQSEDVVLLPLEKLSFPLRVRGWVPGDRVALPYGGKKLKKLFREAGVPAGLRHQLPLLVDARGRVLWVRGMVRSALVRETSEGRSFPIGIRDGDES